MSEAPEFTRPGERDSAIPRFYKRPVQNNFLTDRDGRPIFDEVEFVEINMPGDRLNVVDARVTDVHRKRWPQHYAAFKAGEDAPVQGTPLEEWAAVSRSQVEELRFFKVRTVEDLASLGDEQVTKCIPMGGMSLREKAKRFLEAAAGSAPTEKLAAENAQLRETMTTMEATMKAMSAKLDELTAQANAAAAPAPPQV